MQNSVCLNCWYLACMSICNYVVIRVENEAVYVFARGLQLVFNKVGNMCVLFWLTEDISFSAVYFK